MKVAIVCDWLTGLGGAERVVLELHKLYPDAPIYTSQYAPTKLDWFKDADVRTGWLQKLPKGLKKFLPPLRAWYFSHLKLKGYDLVISSSSAEAKGIRVPAGTVHITYCHSPTHYYWTRYDEYLQHPGFGIFDPLARLGLKLLVGPMRRWDLKAAQRPHHFIANSTYTQANIKKFYKRDSVVVHPPVDMERFQHKASTPRHGFVAAGRQTPYKNIHLAVEACSKLNLPLLVAGDGPDHARLVKLAGPSVMFKTGVSDPAMVQYFQQAEFFILPNADDFGITAVEAMAAGTPVVALKAGGALDTVAEGTSGLFFDKPTAATLADTLTKATRTSFDHTAVAEHAKQFSILTFRQNISLIITKLALKD